MSEAEYKSAHSSRSRSSSIDSNEGHNASAANQHKEFFEISKEVETTMDDSKLSPKSSFNRMRSYTFYNRPRNEWISDLCEIFFKIKARGTTIQAELYFGLIHFISCFYCLAVVPGILGTVNYDGVAVFATTALTSGIGCIVAGFVSNLPFPVAPPTAVTLFLKTRILVDSTANGSASTILSGFVIMILGIEPICKFLRQLVPVSIQVGTSVGIGLLTALAGATEVDLIVQGRLTLIQLGDLSNPNIYITLFGIVLIPILYHYHVKGPFAICIVLCSIIGWAVYNSWPKGVAAIPILSIFDFAPETFTGIAVTVVDLTFLYFLYLNGLIASLSRLSKLTDTEGHTPRMYSLYVIAGATTVLSGIFNGAPMLLSPEGAAACHDGAKTGLSTVICGLLFLLSIFFSPIFSDIPASGTSPILIMVGVLLFQNALRVDWTNIKACTPAFVVLFFVPFTYNLFVGVIVGYITYILINSGTGDLYNDTISIRKLHFPETLDYISSTVGKSLGCHQFRSSVTVSTQNLTANDHVVTVSMPSEKNALE